MASVAPAYRYPERKIPRAPRIRVVPGRGKPAQADTLPSSVILLAKIVAVFLVVFALLGFVRIGLASATVSAAVSSEEISTHIESARSEGNELEVKESYLSNPTNLKTEASKLQMSEASETSVLLLPKDVVTTDGEGNLSLARSLKALS